MLYSIIMSWNVEFTKKAEKQLKRLPERIQLIVATLVKDIELNGPVRIDWPNYSKLGGKNTHHCHIKDGRPSYVACWEVTNKEIKLVEVYYVGTRENAPY